MKKASGAVVGTATLVAVLLAAGTLLPGSRVYAKHKAEEVDASDPTLRVFQLLDSTRDGKLADFYLLADLYKDPDKPDDEYRHVLRVNYDKNRGFGKLNVWVRSVGKMTPEQLDTYTPKQIYDFAETDQEKYCKSSAGQFGTPGDVYLRASQDRPLATAPVTDEVRKSYGLFVTEYLLPALQKK
jgi:hypothetical protein